MRGFEWDGYGLVEEESGGEENCCGDLLVLERLEIEG